MGFNRFGFNLVFVSVWVKIWFGNFLTFPASNVA
jgi:hypothetical protein